MGLGGQGSSQSGAPEILQRHLSFERVFHAALRYLSRF